MDKVDREKSVFEVQKEDVQRQLGEALDILEPDHAKRYGHSKPVLHILDALAVLDNMDEETVENPKEPNIKIWGNIHGYIWVGKGVHLWHQGNRIGYKPDDWEGEWPFEDTIGGTMTIEASEPPAPKGKDPFIGCPQSDAMGGEEQLDKARAYIMATEMERAGGPHAEEPPAEEPEKVICPGRFDDKGKLKLVCEEDCSHSVPHDRRYACKSCLDFCPGCTPVESEKEGE